MATRNVCQLLVSSSLALGFAWGLTVPCRAQELVQEPSAPAVAAPATPTVLWLAPVEPELSNRIRGQLIDTAWQLLERSPNPSFNSTDRNAQLRTAFEQARLTQATAVAWVRESPQRLEVLVLDVAQSRLSARDVPRVVEDSAQQSAAFETAALIVRATLSSIESGTAVGDAVVEPSAAPVPNLKPHRVTRKDSIPPRHRAALVTPWARLGAQISRNYDQMLFGVSAGAGLAFHDTRLGLMGQAVLPHEPQIEYVEAGITRPVALELWRLGLSISAEHTWNLSPSWAVFLGLQPGLTVLHRSTQRSATLNPSSDARLFLPTLGVSAGLAGPRLAELLTPELMVGVLAFARVPTLRVEPAPQAEVEPQLGRFEPWVGLAFRVP